MSLNIEDMRSFCKRKGLIYPSGDIYGGIKGFFDYGPYGVELQRSIRNTWWESFVTNDDDVVGIDGAQITNPKTWQASGHVDSFTDLILESEDGTYQIRADHFLEDELGGDYDGVSAERVDELVDEHDLEAPNGEAFKPCQPFNLMFQTQVGPKQSSSNTAYLRPETAQLIFTNFKYVRENARQTLPFGIAQTGKAFRNEISPRNFLFRSREFEQLEIEHFTHPDEDEAPPVSFDEEIRVYDAEAQENDGEERRATIPELIDDGDLTPWIGVYAARHLAWFKGLDMDLDNIRLREHLSDELAHYSDTCWDVEYEFPFGCKEIMGLADRSAYDLKQHIEASGETLSVHDQEKDEKIIPRVSCEPSLGVDRAFLAFVYDAYMEDGRGNTTLSLHPRLSPNTVAVFPLVGNDEELMDKAESVYETINASHNAVWDAKGSIGRRYARQDEVGTPYCVTVDFDTLDDDAVTIRFRDSTEQERVATGDLSERLDELISSYPAGQR
jgi:glycyl-tRNA synthetase